jgi:cis-3-alkyl-4-acyloxetan-2-one decarboxylase
MTGMRLADSIEPMARLTDWTFDGTWPYESKWFDSPDGRMHYVDEGPREGRPVVMVHGNPTWGYLYRNFIPPLLEAGHRAIVPDHLGFGRSDKPDDPELYRVPRHAERLDALLESLDLSRATVVPQDWGGPIGLYWATQHPERVDALFILNTYAHGWHPEVLPPGKDEVPLPLPLRLFRTPGVGEVLVKGLDAFKRGFLFGQGVVHRERLTPTIKRAYREVHQGWSERTPILVFPREIPVTGEGPVVEMTTEIEAGLKQHFRSKPVQICWPMKDIALTPNYLDQLWLETFPEASVTRLDDAGHYLQEDAHERITPELVSFVGDL